MKRYIEINRKYLLIPVCAEKEVKIVSVLCRNEKILSLQFPCMTGSRVLQLPLFCAGKCGKISGKNLFDRRGNTQKFLDARVPVRQHSGKYAAPSSSILRRIQGG